LYDSEIFAVEFTMIKLSFADIVNNQWNTCTPKGCVDQMQPCTPCKVIPKSDEVWVTTTSLWN
jgi:hypothetical protein